MAGRKGRAQMPSFAWLLAVNGSTTATPSPAVGKAGRETIDQSNGLVRGAQQQSASVRGHRPATEISHNRAAIKACEKHRFQATLCRHRGALLLGNNSLSQKNFLTFRPSMHITLVKNPG